MRIYLPATTTTLRALGELGALTTAMSGGPFTAYAVTPGVREWYTDDDADELEYAANGQAVRASLRMVDEDPQAARRRVVLAFDVADSSVSVRDDIDRGAVRVDADLSLDSLASVHIDDDDARATVARAAAVVLEADLGSEPSQEIVDDAEGYELSWYAPAELGGLLASLDIATD